VCANRVQLRGPFFNPEYIRLVASARSDVRVAVIEDEPYKLRFATGFTELASGSVDCRLRRRLTNAIWYAARRASRRAPVIAALAKSVKRRGQRLFPANR
jgi:hypothetical protein